MNAVPVAVERTRAWPRLLAGAAALWVVLDGAVLLGTFPYWPRTAARWGLLLVAGPALVLSLAGLLELAVVPRIERLASTRGAGRRIAGAILAAAAIATVALCAWWTLRVEG